MKIVSGMPKEEGNKMIRAKSFWLRKLGKKDSLAKKNYESQKLPSGHQTTKCDI